MNTKQKISFSSIGHVLGNCWGGGQGSYGAKSLQADTKEELIKKAKEKLADGSLDRGMGFESLIGAILYITKTTTIVIDDKDFENKEYEVELIGDLDEKQQLFLAAKD